MKKALGIGLKNALAKKRKVNVRMPIKMIEDIDSVISSKKKRSEWICEAISSLYQKENYIDLVKEGWIEAGNNKSVQFQIAFDIDELLTEMSKSLKGDLTDPISSIIRCSAIQKLIS